MLSDPIWHTLWTTLPLPTGMVLQAWSALFPENRGLPCLLTGAALVLGAALYDRDLTLLLAQVLLMPLLWLRVRRIR